MNEKLLRFLTTMELEEKVLHIGVLVCILSIFFPWLGGQWYGVTQQWSGFGSYTGFIGHTVVLLQVFIVMMTLSPLLGGPVIVRKANRNSVRLLLSVLCTIFLAASFSILMRLTSEISTAEIRFGIYTAIIGSVITTLYAFLKYQEEKKSHAQALFRHPETAVKQPTPAANPFAGETLPPPPPPPPPMPPEEHHLFSKHENV